MLLQLLYVSSEMALHSKDIRAQGKRMSPIRKAILLLCKETLLGIHLCLTLLSISLRIFLPWLKSASLHDVQQD